MKQLYLTYCSPGEGLEQGRGQQLRAASAGLSDLRMRRLRAMMGYSIPTSLRVTSRRRPRLFVWRFLRTMPGTACWSTHATSVRIKQVDGLAIILRIC